MVNQSTFPQGMWINRKGEKAHMQQPPNYGGFPPQQPYQPPVPFQPQPVSQPPRKTSRKKPILFGCLGAIILLLVIIVISAIASGGGTPQATSPTATPVTQATTAPTAIPTQAPSPTTAPTKAPAPSGLPMTHGTPRLGGPLSDFIGTYGQPNSNSNPPLFDFIETNNINGVSITGLGSSCSSTQCEVQQQIDNITVQSPDQTNGYSVNEAEAKCMAFAPTDAHFKQKIPYADGTGYDMVYNSASLAKAFPASEFSDGNGGTVAPGTFDISYLYADNKQGIGSCDMITGEQQTSN
jgi:hypothetical protein